MRIALLLLASLLSHSVGAQAVIYRCAGEDGMVYSDFPCAKHADPHDIDESRVTVYTPVPAESQPATSTSDKPVKAKSARKLRAADPDKHRLTCARLEQSLREVRTKMRTGYGVREGERLKARQRQLDQRRRLEKCGR